MTGTYVEARTAEVFAGACIMNGEAATTGREALLAWKVDRGQVNGVTRWNYSIPDSRTLELLAGVEYDTCCWTTRVALRRFVNDVGGETYNALFLQLELKGLTSFGHKGKGGLTGLLDPASSDRGHLFTR